MDCVMLCIRMQIAWGSKKLQKNIPLQGNGNTLKNIAATSYETSLMSTYASL